MVKFGRKANVQKNLRGKWEFGRQGIRHLRMLHKEESPQAQTSGNTSRYLRQVLGGSGYANVTFNKQPWNTIQL